MNRLYFIFVSALLIIGGCSINDSQEKVEESAQQVITLLIEEDFEKVYNDWFDSDLQNDLTIDSLSHNWNEKIQSEENVSLDSLQIESRTENVAVIEATFQTAVNSFDLRLIFNEDRKVVGLHLANNQMHIDPPESIIEEEIIIGENTGYELQGLLSMPKKYQGDLPAVVLVHGSGPTDMDEAAFAYKPFRDIAYGLAEMGIAVIRYDKRTFSYTNEMSEQAEQLTVYEETIEDAIRAIELAKADERINSQEVYIAGHSLGGMLAPRIETEGADVAGLIILAGSPRNLKDIVYDQTVNAIENHVMEEAEKEEARNRLDTEYEKASELQHLSDEQAQQIQVFGLNGYYVKEMEQHPVSDLVHNIDKPFLILQGEEDFQVYYEKDFALWRDILKDREDVTLQSYPDLDHFFIESEGPYKGTVQEYDEPNQVDNKVLKDIGDWIINQDK